MKKNVFEIYIFMLLFFILVLMVDVVQWSFMSTITPLFLVLNALLVIVAGISFTVDFVLAMIISAFIVLIYAAYLFIQVFQGDIQGSSAIGYYIWFLILPIGAFIGGAIKSKFKEVEEDVARCEENKSRYSLKDENTLFYNKSELMIDLKKDYDFFKRKNVYFTTIVLAIQNYDLLKNILNKHELETLMKRFSQGILGCTRSYAKRYYLEEGVYAILILGEEDEKLKENIRKYMDNYLKYIKFRYIEKINVKYSAKAINEKYSNYVEYYRDLIKGLEFDV